MDYAMNQLRRMERHHRWIVQPPAGKPAPDEFGASDVGGRFRFPNLDAQKEYDAALKHWHHFQKWRRERNPKRAALEEKHGYDTKHAMHLVRLLKMGQEVLSDGHIFVRRPDTEWLLGIRDGSLSYGALLTLAGQMSDQLEYLTAASSLPNEPDQAAAEALLVELHRKSLLA